MFHTPIFPRPRGFLFPLLLVAGLAQAESLQDAVERQVQSNQAAAATQQAIDQLDAQTRAMLEEYREALRKAEALNAYNAHLRQLVASQATERGSLEKQLGEIEDTRRDLVPLMLRMADALDQFVKLDRPFLAEERTRRLADLKSLMNQADVNDAEKFRRVLDAYQAENEYGKSIGAYQGELKGADGAVRTVDFLRVGRVALLYQSLDGRETGVWDSHGKRWQVLPADYNGPVRKGLAVARKDSPPELLTIAVEPPEAAR